MLGYLFVRGGVRALAYAKTLEEISGVDVKKLLPIPEIPDADFKEAKPFIARGLHARLYRLTPDDFKDTTAVCKGEHPIDGTPLEVRDDLPEEDGDPADRPRSRASSRPATPPRSWRRLAKKLVDRA